MKTLVICRHAKSDWGQGLPDIERPLNRRGQQDAPKMGKLLRKYQFQPDLVVSSPAVRARTTAELIAREIDYPQELQIEKGIYGAQVSWMMDFLRRLPNEHNTAMVFGHNPTFEALIEQLLDMDGSIVLPTCGMACVELPFRAWRDLSPGSVSLKWFLIPRLISGNPA